MRGFRPTDHVPRRLVVKSDRFAHYALAASQQALDDADLDLATIDPFSVGISCGNNSGGWDICGRGFEEYYRDGPTMVNPWQATAWFPTAPQGFVSIHHGIRGFSKSFAADRASGACGIAWGARSIRWGHADVVLSGGSEAPITRLGVAALVSTGELSRADDPAESYLPFDPSRNGLVLGEGSAVLLLESLEHALGRGARIHGEILAVEQRTGDPEDAGVLERAMAAALRRAGAADGVDCVIAEGSGTFHGDRGEALAIARVLGRSVPVTAPKAAYGHLYGASTGTDVACALLALRTGVVPPTAGTRRADEQCPIALVTQPLETPVETVLVNSHSREGTTVALVVARPHEDRNAA